jgi:hypothetical protein
MLLKGSPQMPESEFSSSAKSGGISLRKTTPSSRWPSIISSMLMKTSSGHLSRIKNLPMSRSTFCPKPALKNLVVLGNVWYFRASSSE